MNDEPACSLTVYHYPEAVARSAHFAVRINDQPVEVLHTAIADVVAAACAGRMQIEISVAAPPERVIIRPLRRGIAHACAGQSVRFVLDAPCHACVEIDGLPQLFFHLDPPEECAPAPSEAGVHYFESGMVHEAGELELKSGERVYIAGGAIVRGRIWAADARDVSVGGRGILVSPPIVQRPQRRRTLHFERCAQVRVEGITVWNHTTPCAWTAACYGCRDVQFRQFKELTQGGGSDGIDIVSCRDVVIEDCCLTTGDDAIVIKALDQYADAPYGSDVDNVLVQRCVLQTISCGSALEIGHELRTPSVRNITFRDCDILAVHGHGAAISIRNGDRALVEHIRYEDIRIEHYYARLFDFRVIRSRYSRDIERGQIRGVLLKDIRVRQSIYNPGYSISTIGSYDERHTITGVVFENVYLDETHVTSAQQLDLFVRDAPDVSFR